ncbi:3266_t:CDS:2, partial [Funneliformis mosseae]
MAKTPKAYNQEIDLDNLDLDRSYILEEFEYINSRLKNYTLEIDGKPVNLFELDKNGKLVPMAQTPFRREQVVAKIASQLRNWNIQTQQGGGVTTSQGGFDFVIDHETAIRASDAWTFQGAPFTPTFLVEVADIEKDTDNSKFKEADERFKNELIIRSTVEGRRRSNPGWRDISGKDVLPGFVLDMSLINRIIDP